MSTSPSKLLLSSALLAGCVALASGPGTKGLGLPSVQGVPSPPRSSVRALVVGVSEFSNLQPDAHIPTAAEDARYFAQAVRDAFAPSDMTMLVGAEATYVSIQKEVNRLLLGTGKEESVILFFATQGALVGRDGFLLGVDTDGEDWLPATSLPVGMLKKLVEKSQARQVLVLADTAHEGFAAGQAVQSGPRYPVAPLLGAMAQGRSNIFVQTMTDPPPPKPRTHGVYTEALVTLLSGQGDLNRDGHVGLDELARAMPPYIERSSPGTAGPSTYGGYPDGFGVATGEVPAPQLPALLLTGYKDHVLPGTQVCLSGNKVPVPLDHVFHTGDTLSLEITFPRAGSAYILGVGPTGSDDLLFPLPDALAAGVNRVSSGATIQILPADSTDPITVYDPVGPEHLWIIWSSTHMDATREQLSQLARTLSTGDQAPQQLLTLVGSKGTKGLGVPSQQPNVGKRHCSIFTPSGMPDAWVIPMTLKHE